MALPFSTIVPVAQSPITIPIYDAVYTPITAFGEDGILQLPFPNSFTPLWGIDPNNQLRTWKTGASTTPNQAPRAFTYFAPNAANYALLNVADPAPMSGAGVFTPQLENGYFTAAVNNNGVNGQYLIFPFQVGDNTSFPFAISWSLLGNGGKPLQNKTFGFRWNDGQMYIGSAFSNVATRPNLFASIALYKQYDPQTLVTFDLFDAATVANDVYSEVVSVHYGENTVGVLQNCRDSGSLFFNKWLFSVVDSNLVSTTYVIDYVHSFASVTSNPCVSLCPLGFLIQPNPTDFLSYTDMHIISFDGTKYWDIVIEDNTVNSMSFLPGTTYAIDKTGIVFALGPWIDYGSGAVQDIGTSFNPGPLIIKPPAVINPQLSIPTLPCYNTCLPYPGIDLKKDT